MADPITAATQVGIPSINTDAIIAAGNTGAYSFAVTALYLMIIGGVLGLFLLLLYRKSFNIRVTVFDNTKGGMVVRDNFRGKLKQIRKGEFTFKIYKAKKYNLRYNEEAFSSEDLYISVNEKGKMTRQLFMTFDSEGQLIAMRLEPSKLIKVPVMKDGKQVVKDGLPAYTEKSLYQALVKQVDIAWFYKEYDKSAEVFDARSWFDKNGWLVLVICLVLTLGVFLYTAYKFSGAAAKMGDVVAAQGELIKALTIQQNSTVVRTVI